jgi:hypothetical protein
MKFRDVKVGDYVFRPWNDGERELIMVTSIKESGQFIILRLGFGDDTLVGYPNEHVNSVRED